MLNSTQNSLAEELAEKIDLLCSMQPLPLAKSLASHDMEFLFSTGFVEIWNPEDPSEDQRVQLTVAGARAIEALVRFKNAFVTR